MSPHVAHAYAQEADRMRGQQLAEQFTIIHADKLKGNRVGALLRRLAGITLPKARPCPCAREVVRADGRVEPKRPYNDGKCPYVETMGDAGRDIHGMPHCFRCAELWRQDVPRWEAVMFDGGKQSEAFVA